MQAYSEASNENFVSVYTISVERPNKSESYGETPSALVAEDTDVDVVVSGSSLNREGANSIK
ncbi:hypothetical protein BELL_0395g00080 [Botrytis elliptica]|uniref:Uncharacterized protein n=1 Tax=Botrytis elliptica TaxID=278938 RepID=A0A4Z1JHN0_9HELO|nr:hypothetical protein BELL_0395g00080 [Botrytis elliptica]